MRYLLFSLLLSVFFHLFLFSLDLFSFEHKTHYAKMMGETQIDGQFFLYENFKTEDEKKIIKSGKEKARKVLNQTSKKHLKKEQLVNNSAQRNKDRGSQSNLSLYLSNVRDKIAKNKIKNKMAERLKLTGRVKLNFLIIKPNVIKDLYVAESSQFPLIDESAMDTVRTVQDLPIIPNELARQEIPVSLEISYE